MVHFLSCYCWSAVLIIWSLAVKWLQSISNSYFQVCLPFHFRFLLVPSILLAVHRILFLFRCSLCLVGREILSNREGENGYCTRNMLVCFCFYLLNDVLLCVFSFFLLYFLFNLFSSTEAITFYAFFTSVMRIRETVSLSDRPGELRQELNYFGPATDISAELVPSRYRREPLSSLVSSRCSAWLGFGQYAMDEVGELLSGLSEALFRCLILLSIINMKQKSLIMRKTLCWSVLLEIY